MVYQMLGVLNFAYITEEMANLLIDNLIFVISQMKEDLIKVFKKASFIGRRILVSLILIDVCRVIITMQHKLS